jgi:hypothetical protein
MDDKELEKLIKLVSTKDLRDEIKKRKLSLGRCPTKMDLAKKLPLDVVKKLAKK